MKLSAVVLLSVNLVAASQVAANAADTASFLQDALAPSSKTAKPGGQLAQAPQQRAARPAAKKRSSYVAMTPVIDGVKLRPFIPGRYLPSESDLQAKKQAEIAAQQAPPIQNFTAGPNGVLTGQISSNNNMSELGSVIAPAAAYALSRPVNQEYIHKVAQVAIQKVKQAAKNYSASHQRAVPGVNPVVPGQVAQLPGSPGVIPEIPEPQAGNPPASTVQVPQPQARPSFPVQVPQYNVAAPTTIVPPPQLSKYEASQLEKLVDSNMPENVYTQGFNGDMRASGQGNPATAGTGPPPFPLSSLPMNARGRAINPPVAQARFGSWHGGSSGLATASFHSYVPIHMAGPMSVKVNQHSYSHHTGTQSISMASHGSSHAPAQAKKPAEKHKPEPHAASYPPYRKFNLYM